MKGRERFEHLLIPSENCDGVQTQAGERAMQDREHAEIVAGIAQNPQGVGEIAYLEPGVEAAKPAGQPSRNTLAQQFAHQGRATLPASNKHPDAAGWLAFIPDHLPNPASGVAFGGVLAT